MADLTNIEIIKLEKLFEMVNGSILGFTHKTLQHFVYDKTNLDIGDTKYDHISSSKVNKVRAFWKIESNATVGKLIAGLLEHWKTNNFTSSAQELYNECFKIAERLRQDSVVENIDAIQPNADDKNFKLLAKSIKDSIEKNEPEAALDRLHTFVIRYIRELCDKRSIVYTKETPLHSLFGGYIRFLKEKQLIESEMTERILKSSISVLEAFNDVRNHKSFAHVNKILNYNEAMLIVNDIANVIRFIETIEKQTPDNWEEILEQYLLER